MAANWINLLGRLLDRQRRAPTEPPAASELETTPAAAPKKPKKNFPNWRALVESRPELWAKALADARDGPRVLIATAVGAHTQFTIIETALAIALTLRGARADLLMCDAALPACLRAKVSQPEPADLVAGRIIEISCPDCMAKGRKVMDVPGLERVELSGLITPEEAATATSLSRTLTVEEIAAYRAGEAAIGEHARAGALRYFGVGDLAGEPLGEGVLRRYFEAALRTAFAARRAVEDGRYDIVLTNHGIYAPHGIINAVARASGARTVAWHTAYRRQCVIFSHDDSYHHTLMWEPTSAWETMPWSDTDEAAIMAYLDSRRNGSRDWIYFNRTPDEDAGAWLRAGGVDPAKPLIGMLTNVVWDAQLHYPANAFPSMIDWMVKTVGWFRDHPDLQLLIRVHPGELAPPGGVTKSRQLAEAEIRKAFPSLPANVFIVGPESKLSTYALMDRCSTAIIYGTKTGVELTSVGMPVIVAGEAWIRNKGVTVDAADEADYYRILKTLPWSHRLDVATTGRARRYAYHFFFRRMIPLGFLRYREELSPPFVVKLASLEDLLPGRHPGFDAICDGVLTGSPFIYQAENLGLHDAEVSR